MTKMCGLLGDDEHWGEEEGRGEGQSRKRDGGEMHFKQRHQGGPL